MSLNIHTIKLGVANSYLIRAEGAILIDSG